MQLSKFSGLFSVQQLKKKNKVTIIHLGFLSSHLLIFLEITEINVLKYNLDLPVEFTALRNYNKIRETNHF